MSNCTTCPNVVGDSYERDCAFPDCVGGWEKAYIEAADEITRLRAALAEAERDAARYRWLRDGSAKDISDIEPWLYETRDELDAAIDAAMEREEER